MRLPKDDVLLLAMHRPPGADPALQGAADAAAEIGVAPDDLLQDCDRAKAGGGHEHRHDLGLEHRGKRVGPPAAAGACRIDGRRGSRAIRCPVALLIDALAAAAATVSV